MFLLLAPLGYLFELFELLDIESLNYIKDKLPDCYICNLDGNVIIGN